MNKYNDHTNCTSEIFKPVFKTSNSLHNKHLNLCVQAENSQWSLYSQKQVSIEGGYLMFSLKTVWEVKIKGWLSKLTWSISLDNTNLLIRSVIAWIFIRARDIEGGWDPSTLYMFHLGQVFGSQTKIWKPHKVNFENQNIDFWIKCS